ncbi:ATP-binding protein [Streptomyces sp. NPDC006326]|uniref:ATP-binding protein n=1 Tax=Streptomyces sp. NPDC006326 TaxID=3156752 RepID=UPI0033A7E985
MEEWTGSSRIHPGPSTAASPDVSCADARAMARDVLAGLEAPQEWVEDVLTVVSELVSNAHRHAGGVTGFEVAVRPGAVTVEVSDRSPLPPQSRPWNPEEPGSFGWRLVNQLADTTDVRFHPGGKTITATFTPDRPRPS